MAPFARLSFLRCRCKHLGLQTGGRYVTRTTAPYQSSRSSGNLPLRVYAIRCGRAASPCQDTALVRTDAIRLRG